MQFSKKTFIAGVILLVIVFIYFATRSDDVAHSYSVSLAATTDQQSYASGEPVTLAVSLTNTGEVATCVSNTTQGNISFASFTRDGQPVASRTVHADILEALSMFVRADLVEVQPGAQATIDLTSSYDPGIQAQALHVSKVDDIYADATFYSIQEPGSYEVHVVYEYPGEVSEDCPAVFMGQSNTATVNFVIE